MTHPLPKVLLFLLVTLAVYLWIGYSITDLSGGSRDTNVAIEITPEGGEAIYWGKGRCFTCHSVGGRGSAVRGPNHGQFGEKFPLPMGARAVARAKERSKKTGKKFTAVDYMVESLASPGAYVVKGYKNEMAVVYAPPISLNLKEIKAVVAYLMAQGGAVDMKAINTDPSPVTKKFYAKIAAASAAGGGDPEAGAAVFEENCADCHTIGKKGGKIGPNLSAIAGKGLKHLAEAILLPAKKIAKGFDTYVVVDKKGRQTIGLKKSDDGTTVKILKKDGEIASIAKSDIKSITIDKTKSVMPDDLSEAMSVKQYQNLLSFLMLQKGKK